MKERKTTVILPAYNAAETLEQTIADIPLDFVDEVIIVDDASGDDTIAVAEQLRSLGLQKDGREGGLFIPVPVIIEQFPENKGYGANQKRCYDLALSRGADIVVMVHPDYQYDPKLIKYFVELIGDGYFDIVLGSRIRTHHEAREGGMPAYKYFANRALTFFENIVSGYNLSEWHTGMRAYSRDVLQNVGYNWFSDDFVFDTQMLFAAAQNTYRIGDIPVPVRYFDKASSINFRRSVRYGLLTVWEALKHLWMRWRRARLLQYAISGFTGLGVNLGTYSILLYGVGVWYAAAAVPAFLAGAVTSFTLQKWWTFEEPSIGRVHVQLARYIVVLLFNTGMNSVLIYAFVEGLGMHEVVAAVFSSVVIAIWSFFIYKHLVFTANRAGQKMVSGTPTLSSE